jgi:hypothetical protein
MANVLHLEVDGTLIVGDAVFDAAAAPHILNVLNEYAVTNGQDSYSVAAVALGALITEDYLVLPTGFDMATYSANADQVGSGDFKSRIPRAVLAQVFMLNRNIGDPQNNEAREILGLLRMEAVANGWLLAADQTEVRFEPAPETANAITEMVNAIVRQRARMNDIRVAALLLPMMAEHTFRTKGHHYITALGANYATAYQNLFRACLVPGIHGLMPPNMLYHTALHWVSPGRAYRVIKELANTGRIPEALRLRINAPPAGTAILNVSQAALAIMDVGGLATAICDAARVDRDVIVEAHNMVVRNPGKFHKAFFAYGEAEPDDREKDVLERARAASKTLAPVLKAYIDVNLRNTALASNVVLAKAAQDAPHITRRAATYFRAVNREIVRNPETIFLGAQGVEAEDEDAI